MSFHTLVQSWIMCLIIHWVQLRTLRVRTTIDPVDAYSDHQISMTFYRVWRHLVAVCTAWINIWLFESQKNYSKSELGSHIPNHLTKQIRWKMRQFCFVVLWRHMMLPSNTSTCLDLENGEVRAVFSSCCLFSVSRVQNRQVIFLPSFYTFMR